MITATAEQVTLRVPERVRGEAMGWHGSALTVGVALGAPLAGAAIDARGAWAGFALVGSIGAVLAVAGLAVQHLVQRRSRAQVRVELADADSAAPTVEPSAATAGV